jgi:hypothetical protein
MSQPNRSPLSDRQLIADALQRQQAQKEQLADEIAAAFAAAGPFCTTIATREIINRGLPPQQRKRVIRAHPYWREHKVRIGLAALVSAAQDAQLDFVQAEVALSEYARRKEKYDAHVSHTVRNPAQKEMLAFTGAVVGFVDTIHKQLMPIRHDIRGPLRAALNEFRKPAAYDFIDRLRNNLLHGEVTVPNTVVTTSANGTHGTIQFDTEELLAFGTWTPVAKQFMAAFPERMPIASVMAECTRALASCSEQVKSILRQNPTDAEIDYHAIEDDGRRWAGGQWMKVVLHPHAKKGTDPYPHLHRWFDADELREIMRRPRHSAEQVELMIALKSPDVACGGELRALLYKLFNVTDAQDAGLNAAAGLS